VVVHDGGSVSVLPFGLTTWTLTRPFSPTGNVFSSTSAGILGTSIAWIFVNTFRASSGVIWYICGPFDALIFSRNELAFGSIARVTVLIVAMILLHVTAWTVSINIFFHRHYERRINSVPAA
jgi:hypothetical protein